MKSIYNLFLAVVCCLVFSGCRSLESTRSAGGFVRAVDHSELITFHYQETVFSGSAFREVQESEIRELSPLVLSEALVARGFEVVESGVSDFYIVVKWNKALSSYSGLFDSIDGPSATMNRRNTSASSGTVRVTLTVELYETATQQLFWRAELPNIFDAIQFTGERVSLSLTRAIQNFPERSAVR